MVLVKISNGRNVQVFRKGVLQILGAVFRSEAQLMRCELQEQLKKIVKMENCQISEMTLKNMVVIAKLNRMVRLRKITTSSKKLQYDSELFPAALITKWHPAHVSVFKNGKVVITGVKTLSHAHYILDSLVVYLRKRSLFM